MLHDETLAGGRNIAARHLISVRCIILFFSAVTTAGCVDAPTATDTTTIERPALATAPRGPFTDPLFGIKITSGIQYGSAPVRKPTPGMKPLYLDMYEPNGTNLPPRRPGIVLEHGGGFTSGSRTDSVVVGLCNELAMRGYACASIDYRLQGDDPPTPGATPEDRAARAAMEDAGMALQWMRWNATTYSVDSTRIAIGGSSAGSIATMLLTYLGGGVIRPARAVVDLWGTMDDYVSAMQTGASPIIVIHGIYDPLIPFSDATEIVHQARRVGVPYELYPLSDPGHSHSLYLVVQGKTLYQHIADFLYVHLQLGTI